ncbi:unnamed protein product [Sphagnum jensenii]|uniref:Uncharacterized protein n=1 Tax=Sphagnum jensenii TaxID=128206 RepID=A0ABP1AHW2_9BRYO
MEPDPRDEELGMKSLPSSCKDAWGKQIPPEPPPFNMVSWIGERSHQSEITMVEQEPKGAENINDPSTILDNPTSIETPISSEQEHQLILLEPDPIREFGIFSHFVLRWICCWTIEPQGSREVDQVLWKWPVKMPFQGNQDASDIMINPVHIVYPNLILTQPKLVIIFFHSIVSRKDIANAWKETWTSITHINGEERPTFWIKEWLVEDMGENIQILSLSYDANIYGVNDDVTDIGKNLIQSLVVNQRYISFWRAPIVLVGHSFGEILVPHASAQRLSRNNYYKIEDANHLTICKPPTRDHISYSKLVDCLRTCLKNPRQLPSLPSWERKRIEYGISKQIYKIFMNKRCPQNYKVYHGKEMKIWFQGFSRMYTSPN